jgi:hypothetical protein
MGPARVGGRCQLGVVRWPSGWSSSWGWELFAGSRWRGMWVSAWGGRPGGLAGGVGQAGVWGSVTCHGSGRGASYMGWATMSRDVAGQGGLFCVGGSVVVGSLEPSG